MVLFSVVKEFRKSVNIWWFVASFLEKRCIYKW